MTLKEAREQITTLADTFESCAIARQKLAGKALTVELFDEINGPERGLENLLGDTIYLQELSSNEVVKLKDRILNALTDSEIDIANKMHAALECYFEPLVEACQTFDANYDNNSKLKTDLIEKLKGLKGDEETKFFQAKCDFMVFQYTNAVEVCNIIKMVSDFWDSKECNLGRLAQISTINSGDMSEDDKQFLKELRESWCSNHEESSISNKFWHIYDLSRDRITGATLEHLGYDSKKLTDLVNLLFKEESRYFATVRKFREALVKDTETSENICVKNSDFDAAMDTIMVSLNTVCRIRNEMWEMFSLMTKISVTQPETPVKGDDKPNPEEGAQKKDDKSTEIPAEPPVNVPES